MRMEDFFQILPRHIFLVLLFSLFLLIILYKLAIVKSKLLKQLSNNYPNFLKKDLEKFTNIILHEIKGALKRGDRVELRGFGIFSTNTQKARISRNPKTGEKVNTPEKKTIHFKMSKDLFKKLNNNNEE